MSDQPIHDGPVHPVMPKRQLAIHLGVWHQSPDGRFNRVGSPSAAYLSRWRLDELEREHRRLHGEEDGSSPRE